MQSRDGGFNLAADEVGLRVGNLCEPCRAWCSQELVPMPRIGKSAEDPSESHSSNFGHNLVVCKRRLTNSMAVGVTVTVTMKYLDKSMIQCFGLGTPGMPADIMRVQGIQTRHYKYRKLRTIVGVRNLADLLDLQGVGSKCFSCKLGVGDADHGRGRCSQVRVTKLPIGLFSMFSLVASSQRSHWWLASSQTFPLACKFSGLEPFCSCTTISYQEAYLYWEICFKSFSHYTIHFILCVNFEVVIYFQVHLWCVSERSHIIF